MAFKDLVNVGKTCKRLQQVAGYCFQQNYLGSAVWHPKLIRSVFDKIDNALDAKHFTPFIHEIWMGNGDLQPFIDSQSKFIRLKTIAFEELKTADMNRLKEIAPNKVECLRLLDCEFNNNFHEIIDPFVNIKRLEVTLHEYVFDLLCRKYPTLEYFKIEPFRTDSIEGFPEFLELNPNIRKLAITTELLQINGYALLASNVKFDDLAIKVDYFDNNDNFYSEFDSLCHLLNELHVRGFYRNLQLYSYYDFDEEIYDLLDPVNDSITKFSIFDADNELAFSSFKNLEELRLPNIELGGSEILANDLINLKGIHFIRASIDDIMPFIKRSVKMQKIKVNRLAAGIHFNTRTKVIDLLALNGEREKLPDAAKITLYVDEEIYLATKWAMKENDFGLIRLKRETSFEWYHDFYNFFV